MEVLIAGANVRSLDADDLEGVDKINDRGTVSYCIGVGSDLAAAITGVHETYLNSVS
jgi:hypothetical protein